MKLCEGTNVFLLPLLPLQQVFFFFLPNRLAAVRPAQHYKTASLHHKQSSPLQSFLLKQIYLQPVDDIFKMRKVVEMCRVFLFCFLDQCSLKKKNKKKINDA